MKIKLSIEEIKRFKDVLEDLYDDVDYLYPNDNKKLGFILKHCSVLPDGSYELDYYELCKTTIKEREEKRLKEYCDEFEKFFYRF